MSIKIPLCLHIVRTCAYKLLPSHVPNITTVIFQAVLGVIVCMGLFGMFKQFKDIVKYFNLSFSDLVSA